VRTELLLLLLLLLLPDAAEAGRELQCVLVLLPLVEEAVAVKIAMQSSATLSLSLMAHLA
jgi:hypothetical protein